LTVSDSYGFAALKTATINVVAAAITKLTERVRRGTAYVLVTVNAPGKLLCGRHRVVLGTPGTARLKLALNRRQQRLRRLHRRFTLSVRLVYAPFVGPPSFRRIRVRL
jgi:hypothetical protein